MVSLVCMKRHLIRIFYVAFFSVVGYSNMEEIINAMKKKEVAGALVDIYAAATKRELFQGGDVQLNRMIEYPTGYGIVLSGNMAKAAPLLREAIAAQKSEISQIIEENTDTISQVCWRLLSAQTVITVYV